MPGCGSASVGRSVTKVNVTGEEMKDDTPSFTALGPALLRAVHQILDDNPKVFTDPVAVGFVDGSSESEILANREGFQSPFMRTLRSNFVLRSRYAEDSLAESLPSVGQYVILGAGLDTFAYRQPPSAKHLRIFEVDHPASQRWKRARLAKVGIEAPPNLIFAPIDFERSSLAHGLGDATFDAEIPTFFSWLGVTQYLTVQAIDQTLEYIASLPSSSQIVFTFVLPDEALGPTDAQVNAFGAAGAAARGEPWITRLEPESLSVHLRSLGFSSTFHLTAAGAQTRYYSGRTDGLPAPSIEELMRAAV
jgi:methyltransferase (TIGR00027 family)